MKIEISESNCRLFIAAKAAQLAAGVNNPGCPDQHAKLDVWAALEVIKALSEALPEALPDR